MKKKQKVTKTYYVFTNKNQTKFIEEIKDEWNDDVCPSYLPTEDILKAYRATANELKEIGWHSNVGNIKTNWPSYKPMKIKYTRIIEVEY